MPTRFPYSYFLARAKKALPGWKFPDTDPGTGKGDDYVSLDVCEVFLPAYRRMTATVTA